MSTKLWTLHFMRICLANLLLFISLYMLYPVLPAVMADRLGVSVSQTGAVFLPFALAMFVVGPFYSYLVDAYKRKYVCAYSLGLMLAATAGYAFVDTMTQLYVLAIVQGAAFGIATTAGITLGIDITNSSIRSAGNVVFSWAARLGMIVGVALGIWLIQAYGFRMLLYVSIAIGVMSIFFVSRVYVPFRAPIGVGMCSIDRFLLLRGWVPALNMVLIALVPGMLLPVWTGNTGEIVLGGIQMPFFAMIGAGFLLSLLLVKLVFRKENKMWLQIVAGLSIIVLAVLWLIHSNGTGLLPVSVLLGIGLGLVTPEFLLIFVKLSHHCQRGTANTTHLLAWEVGVSLGIALMCHFSVFASPETAYQACLFSSVISLIFFVLITYPYFKRKKVR